MIRLPLKKQSKRGAKGNRAFPRAGFLSVSLAERCDPEGRKSRRGAEAGWALETVVLNDP